MMNSLINWEHEFLALSNALLTYNLNELKNTLIQSQSAAYETALSNSTHIEHFQAQ